MTLFVCHCGEVHNSAERGYCLQPIAIVDRPAPPPTTAPVDLDAVDASERKMTPGPWRALSPDEDSSRSILAKDRAGRGWFSVAEGDTPIDLGGDAAIAWHRDADQVGIVALRNAAPALIAELRAARAEIARLTALRCDCDEESGQHAPTCVVMVREQNTAMAAEIARLTAELSKTRDTVPWQLDLALGRKTDGWTDAIEAVRELARLREVPADVEAAIAKHDEWLISNALMGVDARLIGYLAPLRAAIARAIAAARSEAPATVGGLLATAPVGSIVEWRSSTGRGWWQLRVRIDGNGVESRTCPDGWPWRGWRCGQLVAGDMPRPARLVPAAKADCDPTTRGPLPGGEG